MKKTLILMILFLTLLSSASYAESKSTSSQPSIFDESASDPFAEMEKMQTGLNKVFRESMRQMRNYQQAGKFFEPDADFIEKDGNYILSVDLPGMQKDQINIEATDNAITISGQRKTERETKNEKEGVYQFERSSGSFYRSLSLPSDANVDAISARYENGVLEVTIPMIKPETTAKKKVAVA